MTQGFGLLPVRPDERNVHSFNSNLGAGIYKQPLESELPETLGVTLPTIVQQLGDDSCADAGSGYIDGVLQGEVFEQGVTFGFAKLIDGNPEEWGVSLPSIWKARQKYGAIPTRLMPLDLLGKPLSFWREPANWSHRAEEIYNLAAPYRIKSYAEVTGRYDHFTNICTLLYYFHKQGKPTGVSIGIQWGYETANPFIDTVSRQGYGHFQAVLDFNKIDRAKGFFVDKKYRAVVPNTWGTAVGDSGVFYLCREEVNEMANMYGVFFPTDLSAEEAKVLRDNGAKADSWWVTQLTIALLNLSIGKIMQIIKLKALQMAQPIDDQKLVAMALAIKEFEGWVPRGGKGRDGKVYPDGSISYRCNNPGNLKWSKYQIGTKLGHANFATYEDGWKGLLFQLQIAYDGRSRAYSPNMTLLEFFAKYAEGNQKEYSAHVAKAMKVDVLATIKSVLMKI